MYEPISDATMDRSNGTPILAIDASMKSRSVLDRIASFQPRARASSSDSRTSGNASQVGSERESASPSPSGSGSPSDSAMRERVTSRTLR